MCLSFSGQHGEIHADVMETLPLPPIISLILGVSPGTFSVLCVAGAEMCQRLSFFLLHEERFCLLGQGTNLGVVPIAKSVYSYYTPGTGERSH